MLDGIKIGEYRKQKTVIGQEQLETVRHLGILMNCSDRNSDDFLRKANILKISKITTRISTPRLIE